MDDYSKQEYGERTKSRFKVWPNPTDEDTARITRLISSWPKPADCLDRGIRSVLRPLQLDRWLGITLTPILRPAANKEVDLDEITPK